MRRAPRVIQGKRPGRAGAGGAPCGGRRRARHRGGLAAVMLTFWLHFPYQGLRRGCRCPSAALTRCGARSVHGRRATDVRRGTDLLAGRSSARKVKAGVRTPCGKRADGGPRTGRRPGGGEATPAHAPARPLVHGRRGGTASTHPAGTTPGTRAESANTSLTARPAARMRPRHGGPARRFPDFFRLPRVRSGDPGGLWYARGPARFTRGKAILGMTSLASQRSVRQPPRTITRQLTRLPRPAGPPAAPGRAAAAGQRPNIPAGVNRD